MREPPRREGSRRAAGIARPRGAEDWEAVREVCRLTGDAGRPVEPARRAFFAEYWVGPYQRLLPGWTYVARDEGRVAGYLTGCPDTRAFSRRRLLRHRLGLLARVAAGEFRGARDARLFARRLLRLDPEPEACLPGGTLARAWDDYPAHLHVNVAPGFQGRGIGQALVRRFIEDLAAAGVAGVHLVCGGGPVGFYSRLGFRELGRGKTPLGATLHCLARETAPNWPGEGPASPAR